MKNIRTILRKYIFNNKDKNYFYGKYVGGSKLSFIQKSLIILLDLRSLRDYILYHNNPFIVNTFGRAKKKEKSSGINKAEKRILNTLKDDGIVFLDGYFKDQVDKFVKDNIQEKVSDDSYIQNNNIELNEEAFKIMNDKSLCKIASEYYSVNSFYRYRPTANLTYPKRDDINSRQRFLNKNDDHGDFADEWHVDSVYNLQYHILLKDTSENQTRMLFAKGKKVGFFDRFAGYASEEYVRDNFSIIDLYGSKGTVILFDGSIHWHRLFSVNGVKRYTSSVLFTRGQQPCNPNIYKNRLPLDRLDKSIIEKFKFII